MDCGLQSKKSNNLHRSQSQLYIERPASFFSEVSEKAWAVDLSELWGKGGQLWSLWCSLDMPWISRKIY